MAQNMLYCSRFACLQSLVRDREPGLKALKVIYQTDGASMTEIKKKQPEGMPFLSLRLMFHSETSTKPFTTVQLH